MLQVLIENTIGKAKQLLKQQGKVVPVSAYDAFKSLNDYNLLESDNLEDWFAIIGFRNKLVHEYMKIDFTVAEQLIKTKKYEMIVEFLFE